MGVVKVPWGKYGLVVESVAETEGGGFRAYYPSLGFSVYGVGDTISEMGRSLKLACEHFQEFIPTIEGFQMPPEDEDASTIIRVDDSKKLTGLDHIFIEAMRQHAEGRTMPFPCERRASRLK